MATCSRCGKSLEVPVWGYVVCFECASKPSTKPPIMLKTFLHGKGFDINTRRRYTLTETLYLSINGKPQQIKSIKLFRDWNSATYRQYKIVFMDNSITFVMSSEYVYFHA